MDYYKWKELHGLINLSPHRLPGGCGVSSLGTFSSHPPSHGFGPPALGVSLLDTLFYKDKVHFTGYIEHTYLHSPLWCIFSLLSAAWHSCLAFQLIYNDFSNPFLQYCFLLQSSLCIVEILFYITNIPCICPF